MKHWSTLSIKDLLAEQRSAISGLTQAEVLRRQKEVGPNVLDDTSGQSIWVLLLHQLANSLVIILLIAVLISFVAGKTTDAVVILIVIIVNAGIGFFQEYRAEQAVQALQKTVKKKAKVIRDNQLQEVLTEELVPGDIIALEEGDRIPADARLLDITDFKTVESSLTGESLPEEKKLEVLHEELPIADQINMIWMGTYVARGTAKAIVVGTGMQTAIGQIAQDISSVEEQQTHFHKITGQLGVQLSVLAFAGALMVLVVGFLRGVEAVELILFTIAVLVGGIPEGLPAILAVVLAIGSRRMAARNAIIRSLPITESLAVASVIVTDKTGTLTQNTMTVRKLALADGEELSVTGEGWSPQGDFVRDEVRVTPLDNEQVSDLLHAATLGQSAQVVSKTSETGESYFEVIGDPTEAALAVLGQKAGLKKEVLSQEWKIVEDLPFNSDRKFRATKIQHGDDTWVYIVGAPEALAGLVSRKTQAVQTLISRATEWSSDAMRVIGVGRMKIAQDHEGLHEKEIQKIQMIGIIGMEDPIRPETPEAIRQAQEAGIKVIMATGDHKATALSVAKRIGLEPPETTLDEVYSGAELEQLDSKAFEKAVMKSNVFARLTPHMKLEIADVYQSNGQVITMTGDGVNDAPALKKADIGFAMGIVGTDVAREASDIILTDDNFSTILKAIEEGRVIARNIAQTSVNLIVGSVSQSILIVGAMILGTPSPLLASQVLWINLVTSGISDIVLATEGSHGNALKRPPFPVNQGIISRMTAPSITILTVSSTIPILLVYLWYYYNLNEPLMARTVLFGIICFSQIISVYVLRSLHRPLLSIGVWTNKSVNWGIGFSIILMIIVLETPLLRGVFRLSSPGLMDWIIIIAFSLLPSLIFEIYKSERYRKKD